MDQPLNPPNGGKAKCKIGEAYVAVTVDKHAITHLKRANLILGLVAGLSLCASVLAWIIAYAACNEVCEIDRGVRDCIGRLEGRLDDHAAGDAQNAEVLWETMAKDRDRLNALAVDFCRLYNYAHNGEEADDPGPD